MSLFGEFGQLAPGYGEGGVDQPCFRRGGLGLKASTEVFFSESFSDDGRSNKNGRHENSDSGFIWLYVEIVLLKVF